MAEQPTYTIAVAGNPNSGKTTLFNALTGAHQKVGNYPGVTVEKKEGSRRLEACTLHFVDLPGTYSLTTFSLDEVVARNYIMEEHPQVVLDVVDAANLERNLYLAIQLAEIGVPMVLALNMMDIAQSRGIQIDVEALSRELGVPVVATVGSRKDGTDELIRTLEEVAAGRRQVTPKAVHYGDHLEPEVAKVCALVEADQRIRSNGVSRWMAIKLLEMDERAENTVRLQAAGAREILSAAKTSRSSIEMALEEDPATLIAEHRYACAAELVRTSVTTDEGHETLTDKLDKLLCHRVFGLVFVGLVIYATFALTFQLSDGWAFIPWPGGWQTPCGVVAWFFEDVLGGMVSSMQPGPLASLLNNGIIGGVGGVMSFVPLIFFMFLLLAIIEDSGYIARIAFVLDRVLRTFGLQGKSILAMIVSGGIAGGCAVPGVMATRTLNDPKDRLTTMLVAPFMNCGAKIPVFAMLIAAFFAAHKGFMMWLLVVISWSVALLAALTLRKSLIRGVDSPFVMELPPYHLPTPRAVLQSALERSWSYMRKAGTVILAVTVVLWAMMYFPQADTAAYDSLRGDLAQSVEREAAETPYAGLLSGDELAKTAAFADEWEAADSDAQTALAVSDPARAALVQADPGSRTTEGRAAQALAAYRQAASTIDQQESAYQLEYSVAGRVGRTIQPLSRYAGFDWRDNIALVGGFAAKEVIVSTMGTAYAMGAVEPAESVDDNAQGNPLSRQIAASPGWSPLRAFALIIFVMFYAPCLVTTSVIWRESGSWKWAVFATTYSTTLAFALAVIVFQVGRALGIGV